MSSNSRHGSQDMDVLPSVLDKQITEELETLNIAAEDINTMELLLGEARVKFRAAMKDATRKLNELGVKLGNSVEKSRVYYDVREKAKELQQETQAAAVKFERANSHLATAKEMVELAEQEAMKEGLVFDTNWQEMLNQATMKVNEAEKDRLDSEEMHMATASRYEAAEKEVKKLQRSLKRNINKSKPYFEANNEFKLVLEALKSKVDVLTEQVSLAKGKYKAALQNLEIISSNIHHQRHQSPPEQRESGVGAESTFIESKDVPDSPLSSPHISLKGLGFQEVMEECCPLEKDYEGQNLLLRARPNPDRSLSVPSSGDETSSEIDPLSIMGRTHSTDHLDNLSDTASYVSIEAILDQDRLDTDSILSEEGLESQYLKGGTDSSVLAKNGLYGERDVSATEVEDVFLVVPGAECLTPLDQLVIDETLTPTLTQDEKVLN